MNHWCERSARKNMCYVVDNRPKCFVPITNTASGTPESYLAKSLRFSRDSHEIAKDEPQIEVDWKDEMWTEAVEDEPQKKEVEWVYNKRERLWYPYSDGELLFKNELQTDLVNDSPILAKDLDDDEFNPYDEECMRCKHLKLKCEFVP